MLKITRAITSSFENIVGRAGNVRFIVGIVGWSHGKKPARYNARKIAQRAMETKASTYRRLMISRFSLGGAIGGFMEETVGSVEGGAFVGGVLMNWYRMEPFNT